MDAIEFPKAELYSCRDDDECLVHESPEEAIEAYLDDQPEILAAVRHPLTVYGFTRMEVPASQAKSWADDLTETLEEKWSDEYGDPDGAFRLHSSADEIMREAVAKIVAASTVWTCGITSRTELSAEQVEALARKEWPGWFEDDPRAAPPDTKADAEKGD